jgi:multicomponent Na+:H+ antiporter subunit D
VFPDGTSTLALGALLVLFVFGIGKAAIMPFHRWLPAAMVAPTPVSALLHAVAVVKAGVFTLLKVCVFIFGMDLVPTLPSTAFLMYVAAASILLASIVAMRQDNLKRRLAYSTISQLNYIVMGALISSGAAIVGSAMHIAMHAVAKITLFFCAGAILVAVHKTEISDMRGLGKRMPLTMAAFFIGSLGIIGVPPTGGTWSKWYLLLGTLESNEWVLMVTLMLSSLLTIVYLLAIPARAFFPGGNNDRDNDDTINVSLSREAPLPMMLAIVITTLATLGLFFFPQPIHDLAQALIAPGDVP